MSDIPHAEAAIRAFIADHPGYAVARDQPGYRGGTNVITLGDHRGREVVFKWFCHPSRWANELFCLRHFAPTGLVPQVLEAVPDRLIVMERIGGEDLMGVVRSAGADPARTRRLSEALGGALARWCNAAPPGLETDKGSPDFRVIPWNRRPSMAVDHYLRLCRGIQRAIAAYREPPFEASLRLLESRRGSLDRERRVLFHEDISNARAQGERILCFFDLEMCRPGTVSMQLGVALNLSGPEGMDWAGIRRGFEEGIGRQLSNEDLTAVLAMSDFYRWIRVCRWGQWDGDPAQAHHLDASSRDAELWRRQMFQARETIAAETGEPLPRRGS